MIFDQRIAANTVLSVSYVGSQGRNLPIFIDQNLNPATTTNTYVVSGGPLDGQRLTMPLFTTPRPNANFAQMTQITSGVNTSYNALVLALNRRFTKGLQVQTSYTYSKATDNGQSSQTFTAANNVLNPFDLGLEEGTSNFDIPHRFSFSTVWQPRSSSAWLDNFTIAPIIAVSSGAPFTALVSGNAPQAQPASRRAFSAPAARTAFRHIERNTYRLPNTASVDLRVSRAFPIGSEQARRHRSRPSTCSTGSTTRPPTRRSTRSAEHAAAPTLVVQRGHVQHQHERQQRHVLAAAAGNSAGRQVYVLTKGKEQRAKGKG